MNYIGIIRACLMFILCLVSWIASFKDSKVFIGEVGWFVAMLLSLDLIMATVQEVLNG